MDSDGKVVEIPFSAPITVSTVVAGMAPRACGVDAGTLIGMTASDGRTWTYFVDLPGRPEDQLQVGDQLDLSLQVTLATFFDQSVVLGLGPDLVLFSTHTWRNELPKLDAYGITLSYGAPNCTATNICAGTQSPLLVSQNGTTSQIDVGSTGQAGDLVVAVDTTFVHGPTGCEAVDPPDAFRFGGFRPRQ